MQAFDMFLLIAAAVAAVLGYSKGLARQLGSVAGVIAGVCASRALGPEAATWFSSEPAIATVLGHATVFIIAYAAVWAVARLMRKTLEGLRLGGVDRLAGAAFKAFLWMFAISLLLNLWTGVLGCEMPKGRGARAIEPLAPAVIGWAKEARAEQPARPPQPGKGGKKKNHTPGRGVSLSIDCEGRPSNAAHD